MNLVRALALLLCLALLLAGPLQGAASKSDDGDGEDPDANDTSDDPDAVESGTSDDDAGADATDNETDEADAEPDEPSGDADDPAEPENDDKTDDADEGDLERDDDEDTPEPPESDDRDEDEDRDEDDREDRRDVRLRVDDDEAEVRSRGRAPDTREEVELRFRAREAGFRLEMRNDTGADRVEIDLHVTVPQVLEYEDLDGNGRYDLTDRILRAVDLRAIPAVVADVSDADGARFRANYALPDGGTFALVTWIPEADARVGNVTVRAGEAKLDFLIDGFNYSSPTSALALRVDVDSRFDARAGATREVASESGNQRAYFRWADWALVDDAVAPVHATVYSVEEHGNDTAPRPVVYLSYPRGGSIVHDPTIGVVTVQSMDHVVDAVGRLVVGDLATYAATVGVSLALVGGLAWARTGGPRKNG